MHTGGHKEVACYMVRDLIRMEKEEREKAFMVRTWASLGKTNGFLGEQIGNKKACDVSVRRLAKIVGPGPASPVVCTWWWGTLDRPVEWAAAARCHLPNVLVGVLLRQSCVPACLSCATLGIPFLD